MLGALTRLLNTSDVLDRCRFRRTVLKGFGSTCRPLLLDAVLVDVVVVVVVVVLVLVGIGVVEDVVAVDADIDDDGCATC